ncbi:MAG: LytR/AlgR family response regulator transcription factor [Bacteroidales bacterium]
MEKKLTYMVVDDDFLAHNALGKLLNSYDFLEHIGSYYDAYAAVSMLKEKKPDLLFLDIEMPGMSGMELLEIIDKSIKVIITSSYTKYALDAMLYNIVGYLKKPIRPELLSKTLTKVLSIISISELSPLVEKVVVSSVSFLNVKKSGKKEKLYTSDILYINSKRNAVNIVRDDKIVIKYNASLKRMTDLLSANDFVRISKTCILSIAKIKYRKDNKIMLIDNSQHLLSPEYNEQFDIIYKREENCSQKEAVSQI